MISVCGQRCNRPGLPLPRPRLQLLQLLHDSELNGPPSLPRRRDTTGRVTPTSRPLTLSTHIVQAHQRGWTSLQPCPWTRMTTNKCPRLNHSLHRWASPRRRLTPSSLRRQLVPRHHRPVPPLRRSRQGCASRLTLRHSRVPCRSFLPRLLARLAYQRLLCRPACRWRHRWRRSPFSWTSAPPSGGP